MGAEDYATNLFWLQFVNVLDECAVAYHAECERTQVALLRAERQRQAERKSTGRVGEVGADATAEKPADFHATTHNLALLAHEAVTTRLEAVAVSATEEPNGAWFSAKEVHGQLMWRMTKLMFSNLPDTEDTGIDWLQAEQAFPAPRRVVGGSFTESAKLGRNFKRGVRSTPRSTNKQPRLDRATTDEQLDALMMERLQELVTARTEGSVANSISFFMKYRHWMLEGGRRPFRWELYGVPSREVMYQECQLWCKFILWGTLFWRDHGVLSQACSAVRTVHRRIAGIEFPIWPQAKALLSDCARRMNAESGPPKERDFLSNFEMNAMQELVVTFLESVLELLQEGKTVRPQTLRRAVKEAGCDMAVSLVREHGSRPGELLPGKEWDSKWGGLRSVRNLFWSKWHVQELYDLVAAGVDGVLWIKLPRSKTEFVRSKLRQKEVLQKEPFIFLTGDMGRFSTAAAAARLMQLDQVQFGELEREEPAVRSPKHLGGTGRPEDSQTFDAYIKEKSKLVLARDDPRVVGGTISGYSVRKSSALAQKHGAMEVAASEAQKGTSGGGAERFDVSEARRKFLHHTNAKMGLRYDCDSVEGMTKAAMQAAHARYTPRQHLDSGPRETVRMTLVHALGEGAESISDSVMGPMQRGWEDSNLETTMAALRLDQSMQAQGENLTARFDSAMARQSVCEEQAVAWSDGALDSGEAEGMALETGAEDSADAESLQEAGPSTQGKTRSSSLGGIDSSEAFLGAMADLKWGGATESHWAPGQQGHMRLCSVGVTRKFTVVSTACADEHPAVLRSAETMQQCTFWEENDVFSQEWHFVSDLRKRFAGDEEELLDNPVPETVMACPAREDGKWQLAHIMAAQRVGGGSVKVWTLACRLQSGETEVHPAASLWDTRYAVEGRALGQDCAKRAFFGGQAMATTQEASAAGPGTAGGSQRTGSEANQLGTSGEASQDGSSQLAEACQGAGRSQGSAGDLSPGGGSVHEHDSDGQAGDSDSGEPGDSIGFLYDSTDGSDARSSDSDEEPLGGQGSRKRRRADSVMDLEAAGDGAGHGDGAAAEEPLDETEQAFFSQSEGNGSQGYLLGRIPRAVGPEEGRRLARAEDAAMASGAEWPKEWGEQRKLGSRGAAQGTGVSAAFTARCTECGLAMCACEDGPSQAVPSQAPRVRAAFSAFSLGGRSYPAGHEAGRRYAAEFARQRSAQGGARK